MPQGTGSKRPVTEIPNYPTPRPEEERTPVSSQEADLGDIEKREEISRRSASEAASLKKAAEPVSKPSYSLAYKMRSSKE
jgi:hypothetical protein